LSPSALVPKTDKLHGWSRFFSRYAEVDVLFLFYFLALTRQWFWSFENNVAWIITIPVACAFWALYVSTRESDQERPDAWFWLIVGLPLLFAYALRFPFPDTSFDVWSLRLFHGERALHGFLYRPAEFFPTSAPFNPTPDMITGLFRHMLGYRLGTVVNLLALLWSATIIDKILRPLVSDRRLRAVCVLLVVFVEHLLFEINNYMPDLLALPVLLEATRLTLEQNEVVERKKIVRVAFLIGVAIALKLSNGAVAMPLVLIWLWRLLKPIRLQFLATTAMLSLAVTIPLLLPFTIWVYKLTGSPIFPLYNGVFRSSFYPPFNGWDDRWGGYGPFEILAWPVLIFFHPERTAEISVYSGRLSLAFVSSLICLVFVRKLDPLISRVAFIIFLGSLLWSVTMGYIRYGLLLEVLSGVLLVSLGAIAFQRLSSRVLRVAIVGVTACLLIGQSTLATSYVLRMEWSMRPTLFDDFKTYRNQTRNVLHDFSLRSTLPTRERDLFDQVSAWVVSGSKTSGPMILLNERPPFIGVRSAGLFLVPATREVFLNKLDQLRGRRLSSLALHSDFGEAVYALRQAGLGVGDIETVLIPFFSERDDLVQASFFEVTKEFIGHPAPERTAGTTPLSAEGFRATVSPSTASPVLKPGEILDLYVRVKNEGAEKWPSLSGDGKYPVLLVGHWSRSHQPEGSEENLNLGPHASSPAYVAKEIPRVTSLQRGQAGTPALPVPRVSTALPYDLPPGETVVLLIRFRAPAVAGDYTLELDMMQESVGTFASKGSKPSVNMVKVEP
jgi:hypothetical protein